MAAEEQVMSRGESKVTYTKVLPGTPEYQHVMEVKARIEAGQEPIIYMDEEGNFVE